MLWNVALKAALAMYLKDGVDSGNSGLQETKANSEK